MRDMKQKAKTSKEFVIAKRVVKNERQLLVC